LDKILETTTQPLRLLIADLNHAQVGKAWSVLPVPLNAGYLASFSLHYFSGDLEVKICKTPFDFIEVVESWKPDVVAISNYIWNSNLSTAASQWVRAISPSTLLVFGGPNINTAEPHAAVSFLVTRPWIDFYIPHEGEVPLLRVLEAFEGAGRDRKLLTGRQIEGCWSLHPSQSKFSDDAWPVEITEPPGGLDRKTGRLLDLADVPSPYLSGVLDTFLAHESFVPLIETNRGCPYSCTFCSWGDMAKSKSSSFPMERVMNELAYIGHNNVSRVSYLYIGDANFGLFKRDVDIAAELRRMKDESGFPSQVYLYFAKNSSDKVLQIAESLKDMTPISLSRQTQNPDVLTNIKRSNINLDMFTALSRKAKELGVESFVELIYGLPGESAASFFDGVKEILSSDVDGLHFFPAMLLGGSEMSTEQSRQTFKIKGEFRTIDGAAGDYGPFAASEFEEIVTSTAVYSRDDYFHIRRFHFVQAVLVDVDAGGRLFYPIRALLGKEDLFRLLDRLSRKEALPDGPYRSLLHDFDAAAAAELHTEDDVERLKFTGAGQMDNVKLNPYFLLQLIHAPGNLEDFLSVLARILVDEFDCDEAESTTVCKFISDRVYGFDGALEMMLTTSLDVDVLARSSLQLDGGNGGPLLLERPRDYRLVKEQSYTGIVGSTKPEVDILYDTAMHHSRENMGRFLTWRIEGQENDGDDHRTLTNEGGWLF